MGAGSAIAIFFVIWWLIFFPVLAWGRREPDPVGERVAGAEPSAPAHPRMRRRVFATTALTVVAFAAVYAVLTSGLTLDDIPLPSPPDIVFSGR